MQTETKPRQGRKIFFIVYFAILILTLTVIGIFRWLGYYLIKTGVEYFIFGLLICSALIGLTFFLTGRVYRKAPKILIGSIGVIVTFALAIVMISVFKVVITVMLPNYYNSYVSPSGKTAVVLRQYSADEERIRQRVEGEPQGVYEELGLAYTAYPKAAGIFYKAKEAGEGELEIGCISEAQLMYEWTDENTLHLFIKDPQPGDSGEYFLTLE